MANIIIYRKTISGASTKTASAVTFGYNYVNPAELTTALGALAKVSDVFVVGITADLCSKDPDSSAVAVSVEGLKKLLNPILDKHIVIFDNSVIPDPGIPNLLFPLIVADGDVLKKRIKKDADDPNTYRNTFEITCAFYQKLLTESIDKKPSVVKAWANQLAPNSVLTTAAFDNPSPPASPPTTPLLPGTKFFRLFASAKDSLFSGNEGTLSAGDNKTKITFDLSVLNSQKQPLGLTPIIDGNSQGVELQNNLLSVTLDPVHFTSATPPIRDIVVRTDEQSLDDVTEEEAKTRIRLAVNFIEDVKIEIQSNRFDLFKLSSARPALFPGIKGAQIKGRVKFTHDTSYYDINDFANINRVTGFSGTKAFSSTNPLFSWLPKAGTSYFSVDTSGNIIVPPNDLLSTGPFKASITFQDAINPFPVTDASGPYWNRLTTSIRLEAGTRDVDYSIVQYEPLTIKLLSGSSLSTGTAYDVLYEVAPRSFQESTDSRWWGDGVISLQLNANYTPANSTVPTLDFWVTPPIQWYPLLNAGRIPSDFSNLLSGLVNPTKDVLNTILPPLNQLKGGVQLVQQALPLLALFDGFRLENLVSAILGPTIDQFINILDTGFYWNYLWPNESSLLNRSYLSHAAYEAKMNLITGTIFPAYDAVTSGIGLLGKAGEAGGAWISNAISPSQQASTTTSPAVSAVSPVTQVPQKPILSTDDEVKAFNQFFEDNLAYFLDLLISSSIPDSLLRRQFPIALWEYAPIINNMLSSFYGILVVGTRKKDKNSRTTNLDISRRISYQYIKGVLYEGTKDSSGAFSGNLLPVRAGDKDRDTLDVYFRLSEFYNSFQSSETPIHRHYPKKDILLETARIRKQEQEIINNYKRLYDINPNAVQALKNTN